MQLHPQDRTVAILDSMTEAACLRPSSSFARAAWPVIGYRGAAYHSEALDALARDFDADRAGFDTIRSRYMGPRRTVSAMVDSGVVGQVDHKLNGVPTDGLGNPASRDYLHSIFQAYADVVTPAFGERYKIRLEDRSGKFAFHHDDGIMVATLGLDARHTPTVWKNRLRQTVSGNPGDVTIVTPPLLHSSPDVPMRPVLSASRRWDLH